MSIERYRYSKRIDISPVRMKEIRAEMNSVTTQIDLVTALIGKLSETLSDKRETVWEEVRRAAGLEHDSEDPIGTTLSLDFVNNQVLVISNEKKYLEQVMPKLKIYDSWSTETDES